MTNVIAKGLIFLMILVCFFEVIEGFSEVIEVIEVNFDNFKNYLPIISQFYSGMRKLTTSCSTQMRNAPTGVFIRRPSMPTMAFFASSTNTSRVR